MDNGWADGRVVGRHRQSTSEGYTRRRSVSARRTVFARLQRVAFARSPAATTLGRERDAQHHRTRPRSVPEARETATSPPGDTRPLLRTRGNRPTAYREQLRSRPASQKARPRSSPDVAERPGEQVRRRLACEGRARGSPGSNRRSLESARTGQSPPTWDCRVSLLWRHVDRGDGRRNWSLAAYGKARLGTCTGLAAARDAARGLTPWRTNRKIA